MARKMMQKEVTFTRLKIAKMEVQDKKPVIVELPDEVIIGTINEAKAQKLVNKKHNSVVTILETIEETKVYEMPVAEFIKLAQIKGEETPEETNEETEEEIVEDNSQTSNHTINDNLRRFRTS